MIVGGLHLWILDLICVLDLQCSEKINANNTALAVCKDRTWLI